MNNILLIDDDVKLAGLLTEYFRRFDLALISALHPRAGLELLQEAKPDLVVLDIMLPGMDGFEVCRRIRQDSTWSNVKKGCNDHPYMNAGHVSAIFPGQ